jgi:signal transduction histidine kinase
MQQVTSKTVKEHLIFHQKKAFTRAGLLTIVFGLPLLLWSLKVASQKAAAAVVEPQKAYLSYLLSTNNFAEIQRSLNSISYSETIQQVVLTSEDGKILATSVPKNSKSFSVGSESVQLDVSGNPSVKMTWAYQISWTVILVVLASVFFAGLCIAIFLRSELIKIGKTLSRPLELISAAFREISKVQSDLKVQALSDSGFREVDILDYEFSQLFQRLNAAEKRVILLAQQEALNKVAAQVAHDIRSPLSSLNMLASDALLPNEKKEIFQNAISRINDIANELLVTGKTFTNDVALNLKPVNVNQIVEEIVLEKKSQFQNKPKISFEVNLDSSEKAFSRVSPVDFARIISNLLNNAVEALVDESGQVMVGVRVYAETISIFIQDNGRGMSPEMVDKLGKEVFTTGSGSGLGTAHAFTKIKEWGGNIEVVSKVKEGTVFNIQLIKDKS